MKNTIMAITTVVFLALTLVAYGEDMQAGHHHMMGEMEHSMETGMMHDEDMGICPVMHNKASKEYSYTYEGKTYYFCCPMCIEEFKKDPEKYISRIKEVDLEAFQFGFSPDMITVKKGDIVKIYATSRDVAHGFSIKEYDINVPLEKGKAEKIEFLADKAGEFDIACSVYCGAGHGNMKAKLIVEE